MVKAILPISELDWDFGLKSMYVQNFVKIDQSIMLLYCGHTLTHTVQANIFFAIPN